MRNPDEQEKLTCPNKSSEILKPERVWESKKPDGKPIVYGTYKKHHHWAKPCDQSGLVGEVWRTPSKDTPTAQASGVGVSSDFDFNIWEYAGFESMWG